MKAPTVNLHCLLKILSGIVFLLLIALLVIGSVAQFPNVKPIGFTVGGNQNRTCYKSFQVVKYCSICFEEDMLLEAACEKTGSVEIVQCGSIKHIISCTFSLETKSFCIFVASAFLISIFFNVIVCWRRNSLDMFLHQRLQQRIIKVV